MDVRPTRIEVATHGRTGIALAAALFWLWTCSGPAWPQQQETSPTLTASPSDAASANPPAASDPNAAVPSTLMDTGTSLPAVEITVETLEARKKQITESQDLSDELKARLADIYDKAIAQLTLAGELKAKRKQFSEAVKSARTSSRASERRLTSLPPIRRLRFRRI